MYEKYIIANLAFGKSVDEIMLGLTPSLLGSCDKFYIAAKKLYDENIDVKFSTMARHLSKNENIELMKIYNDYSGYTDVKAYIKKIKDNDFIARLNQHFNKKFESINEIMDRISAIPNYESDKEIESPNEIAEKVLYNINNNKNTRVKTDIFQLDEVTRGLGRNELIILSAHPSVGKTQFIMQMLHTLSKKEPVCFVSLEMTKEKAIERMLPFVIGVKADSFYKKEYTEEELVKLKDYEEWAPVLWNNFNIIEPENYTVDGIMLEIRKLESKIKKSVKFICIDYLSKIEGGDGDETLKRELSNACYLKKLCNKKDKTIILINAMNKSDQISGLKKLEHEADQMWLMSRNITSEDSYEQKQTKIKITKNRNSIVGGTADFIYNTDYLRFD